MCDLSAYYEKVRTQICILRKPYDFMMLYRPHMLTCYMLSVSVGQYKIFLHIPHYIVFRLVGPCCLYVHTKLYFSLTRFIYLHNGHIIMAISFVISLYPRQILLFILSSRLMSKYVK